MLQPLNKQEQAKLVQFVSERSQEISADILIKAQEIIDQVKNKRRRAFCLDKALRSS